MAKKLISLFILTAFLLSVMIITASAKVRVQNERLDKLSHYSFLFEKKAKIYDSFENNAMGTGKPVIPSTPLGSTLSESPGADVVHTYQAYQQNSTMGRLVAARKPNPQIHFSYTKLFTKQYDVGPRVIGYNVYDPLSGTWPKSKDQGCSASPVVSGQLYRFTNTDVMPVGGAVVVGHGMIGVGERNRSHVFYDMTAPTLYCGGFGSGTYIPDAVSDEGSEGNGEFGAPKLEYQVLGTDTVTYVFAYEYWGGWSHGAISLFRKAGVGTAGTWERAVTPDTVFFMMQDVSASRVSGKVAICWGRPVGDEGDGNNDVWVWTSDDMGVTWDPGDKVNITNYATGVPGYRSWLEMNILITSDDYVHVIWNGNVYNGVSATGRSCRLFHWTDKNDVISTIQNAEWDAALNCDVAGSNVLNVAKFNISECNNRLYAIWCQWGDPEVGDTTDCASTTIATVGSSANADIYLSVSTDLTGDAWDKARNITDTKSPDCDTTAANPCYNENWPSMTRFGFSDSDPDFGGIPLTWDAEAMGVDPDPDGYAGDYYLDVMYVQDLLPGYSIPDEETPYTWNPVKWFRLPCVDPIIQADMDLNPGQIVFPEWVGHGKQKVYDVIVENSGNAELVVTSSYLEKTLHTGDDWLDYSPTTFNVPYGAPNNIDTVQVTVNKGGIINDPGTLDNIAGSISFVWNLPDGSDTTTLMIDIPVADTLVNSIWDTISTNWVSLSVSNNGNMGQNYKGEVNMDFYNDAFECDNLIPDTIPGDATIYLGDGSPIVITDVQGLGTADTTVSVGWAIFDEGFDSEHGFKPIYGGYNVYNSISHYVGTSGGTPLYDACFTGTFITPDSTVALEKIYFAPIADVSFIVQVTRIFSYDGLAHDNMVLGEAFDWDIPSDSSSYNSADSDPLNDLVFLKGGEWNEPEGDGLECMDNDNREGGAAMYGYYTNTAPTFQASGGYGSYTELNEDYVYPTGGFVPVELYRLMMTNSGLNPLSSSVIDDQHQVVTYFDDYDLGATDTLYIVTIIGTEQDASAKAVTDAITAGKAWYDSNETLLKTTFCCRGKRGDANCAGGDEPDISDIVRVIDFLYLSKNALCCPEEADATGNGGDPDISDIVRLIDYLYLSKNPMGMCTYNQ